MSNVNHKAIMSRFIRATNESPTGFYLIYWWRTKSGEKACTKSAIVPKPEHVRLCLTDQHQELGITETELQEYLHHKVEAHGQA